MLSRKIDTRAVYVIGVSTLLAMSENVFPAYFRALPHAIQTFTASPLALCLTFAVGLTLLFRFGTRQSGEIKWTDSKESIDSTLAFLRTRAKAWSVPGDVIELSSDHVTRVIQYILEEDSSRREGVLRASFNGVDLRLEIDYEGRRAEQIPDARQPHVLLENELENEESTAWVGLQNFLRSLAVDRQQLKTQAGQTIIRLFYAI